MNNIGQKIRKVRKIEGLSQEEFADRIGVARQTISKWECEEVVPTTLNLLSICEEFNVPNGYFTKDYKIKDLNKAIADEKLMQKLLRENSSEVAITEDKVEDVPRQPHKALKLIRNILIIVIVSILAVAVALTILFSICACFSPKKDLVIFSIAINLQVIILLIIVTSIVFVILIVVLIINLLTRKNKKR